jgi:hypothetical protein
MDGRGDSAVSLSMIRMLNIARDDHVGWCMVRYSLFVVHCSWFIVRDLLFVVYCSSFVVRRSPSHDFCRTEFTNFVGPNGGSVHSMIFLWVPSGCSVHSMIFLWVRVQLLRAEMIMESSHAHWPGITLNVFVG